MKYSMKRVITLLAVVVILLSGCTSYRHVKLENQPLNNGSYYLTEPPIYAGDKIKYQLMNGEKGEMSVVQVTPQSIIGNNHVTIPLSQIDMLEKQEVSTAKTGAAVGGGAVAIGVILTAVLAVGLATAVSG
ncbi:hypothetical protein D781_3853 [Serratia sp. FGI94]|uniref:hypothetical protein n=1 Tax=Serratia sp. FGI94 TaxID=671990 RepID=UPI0002A73055|nr:hypothetical protein [Serratia sp. FGI94]AGB84047.1 hypothetical protein D781_3853 [Serratia sp. FGI94]